MHTMPVPLPRIRSHPTTVLRAFLSIALLCAVAAAPAAPATAPATIPAAAKPDAPPVVVAAVKSLDDLDAFARATGLTLPGYLTPQGIEERLAFIPPGGLVRDKPVGLAVGGTADFKPDQNWALVLPLRPNVATVETFRAAKGDPVPGRPDAVVLGAATFRRTPDSLVFGPRTEVVTGLKPEALADAVKGPNALARVVVDLKAMRRSMPAAFNGLFADVNKDAAGDPAKAALSKLLAGPVRDKLDRIEVGLDRSRESVRLLGTFEPVSVPKPGKFTRPGLPAGTFVRIDLAVPPAQALPFVNKDLLRAAIESGRAKGAGKKLAPAEQREMEAFFSRTADLFFGADAVTLGVATAGDVPTVYAVNQYARDVDFAAGLRRLAADAQAMAAGDPPGQRSEVAVEAFTAADGSKATRVRAKGAKPGDKPLFLDVVQKGRTVLLTAGPVETHAALDRLLAAAAKPEGEMKAVAEGWVDLEGAGTAAGLGKDTAAGFKGQRLTWTAAASAPRAAGPAGAEGLTVDVAVPPALISVLAKAAGPADAGKAAKPPAGGL